MTPRKEQHVHLGIHLLVRLRAAAAGSPSDRDELAAAISASFGPISPPGWRAPPFPDLISTTPFRKSSSSAFVRMRRALEAAGAGLVPSFRAFLYGVIRNVGSTLREPAGPRDLGSPCRKSWSTRTACRGCSSEPGPGRS